MGWSDGDGEMKGTEEEERGRERVVQGTLRPTQVSSSAYLGQRQRMPMSGRRFGRKHDLGWNNPFGKEPKSVVAVRAAVPPGCIREIEFNLKCAHHFINRILPCTRRNLRHGVACRRFAKHAKNGVVLLVVVVVV